MRTRRRPLGRRSMGGRLREQRQGAERRPLRLLGGGRGQGRRLDPGFKLAEPLEDVAAEQGAAVDAL